ncbi:MAG: riboflavin synthase [Candidatus Sericytochromatia bacterium]|nr:riboflavin synthase [Candidatus Sericytochromatia bacterium]
MFTGLVEALGTLVHHGDGVLAIRSPEIASQAALGDSIATNGICLTVTRLEGDVFWADYSATTRAVTTVAHWKAGDRVNLEQALTLGKRLGGHLVTGHVDGIGTVRSVRPGEAGVQLEIEAPLSLHRYMVEKGSITVDGVSLTIVTLAPPVFRLTIVPHTWTHTALVDRRPGSRVNLEVDTLAKYVEKLLAPRLEGGGLTLEEMARQGY